MKLGAIITSERGKAVRKTGNDHITMMVNDENEQPLFGIRVKHYSDGIRVWHISIDGSISPTPMYEIKKTNENLRRDKEYMECEQCGKDIEIRRNADNKIILEDCPRCGYILDDTCTCV